MIHTVIDNHIQPSLTPANVLPEWEVPEGYKHTKLRHGEGQHNYEELDYDWRNKNNDNYLSKEQVAFILYGHKTIPNILKYNTSYSQ